MSNTDKDYLDQITEDDEVVTEVADDVDEKKTPSDKAKLRLETRRRLEDLLEAKRLYAELDDYA